MVTVCRPILQQVARCAQGTLRATACQSANYDFLTFLHSKGIPEKIKPIIDKTCRFQTCNLFYRFSEGKNYDSLAGNSADICVKADNLPAGDVQDGLIQKRAGLLQQLCPDLLD